MDGNNGLEIKGFVLAKKQIFIIVFLHVFKDGVHDVLLSHAGVSVE
jgi:hypothetical protein